MSSLISPQFHSRNDLREWPALLRKGARSLKIDPHFVDHMSDKFVLSHNTPLPWQYHQNEYSTLDDVLVFFQHAPSYLHGQHIDIALCFKAAPRDLCHADPSEEVRHWMHMADTFFAQADVVVQQIQQEMSITLTFVLDGDGKPCDCLADKFLPWKSVWIDKDECSRDCYNSTDGFCQRFTILNDPITSDWRGMAAADAHYGKFGLNRNQTLQIWEPDAQLEISQLIEGYLQGYHQGVPSGGGLAFATNTDQAMFDTFTARPLAGTRHARGFNLVVQDDRGATEPSLEYKEPGKVMLRYQTNQKQVERTLTFQPFTKLEVGSPVHGILELGPTETSFFRDSIPRDIIQAELGTTAYHQLSSWSVLKVLDYSFIFAAVGGKVYAAANRDTYSASWDFRLIGLGTHVHASSLNTTVLLVTEGNHCYNSHENNIRAGPLLCSPQEHTKRHACPFALDYSVATAENWFLWLQGTRSVITSCNSHILHGTFSGGQKPSGALFPLHRSGDEKQQSEDKVGIMVAHEPFPENAQSQCGMPLTGEKGIVLASFAIPVVRDRFSETVQHETRVAMEESSFDDFMGIKVLFALGLLGCWLVLRWRRKRTEPYWYEGCSQDHQAAELVPVAVQEPV